MHILMVPSFSLTINIGAPHGDEMGLIKHLSTKICNCFHNSWSFVGVGRYGARAMGIAPGASLIWNSTWWWGGSPSNSFGNTPGKSHTIGMFSIWTSPFTFSVTLARKVVCSFCKHFRAFRQDMTPTTALQVLAWIDKVSPLGRGRRIFFPYRLFRRCFPSSSPCLSLHQNYPKA